ncbi:hypothetical protein L6164_035671 [Bauhinia variegata]|nr:hypothetical protein L6164_035671 [Bauhinia variegata]
MSSQAGETADEPLMVAEQGIMGNYGSTSTQMETVGTGNKENEFWEGIGEDDFHQLMMMMMDFNGDSSDSATGNTLSS